MNQEIFYLSQRIFFFGKRKVEVNLSKNEIKVNTSSPMGSKETTFRVDEMDENIHHISQKAPGWLLAALTLLGIAVIYLVTSYLHAVYKINFVIGLVMLLLGGIALYQYFVRTFDVLLYKSMVRNISFCVCVNKPNQSIYEEFINKLNERINNASKERELRSIIQNIPAEYLEKEFTLFYIQELAERGVNTYELIESMKKSFIGIYVPENLVGNRIH